MASLTRRPPFTPPPPSRKFLVIISVRDWVKTRAIVRLEGLGQLKNPMTSSGIENATFRLVAKCLNQLSYCVLFLSIMTNPKGLSPLEKPPVAQLFKNFPTFYGTRSFITVFIRARHRSLPKARWIQSISPRPISLKFILVSSSQLRRGPPSGLFPSSFSTKPYKHSFLPPHVFLCSVF
jgi:hypothetical protein